jgi:protein involved in polysaccharide export with SLBB domain
MAKPTLGAIARALGALLLLCLCACAPAAGTYNAQPMTQHSAAVPAAAKVSAPQEMALGSGDKVRVGVAGAEKLNGEYEIDLSGALSLPLIGAVNAAGKTAGQVQAEIGQRLRDEKLMENPNVSVALAEGRPFYALGEVKNPGKYPYVAGLNIISAIATAGGFTTRAEQDYVFVRHPGQSDEVKVPLASALAVEPGDIIRVGARVF